MPIKTFKHKGLKRFFENDNKSGITPAHSKKIGLVLDLLDAATVVKDMSFVGSDFHPLKGDKEGCYAVSVSGNWRIVFRFKDGDAYDVDLVDYH